MAGPSADVRLHPIALPRAHEYAADELRRLILLRVVVPGQRLPSELELGEALEMSPPTIRQALHELEKDDLVEIRRGRNGGAYVTGVPALGDGSVRVDRLKSRADSLRQVLEFRRILEPEAAAAAARASAAGKAKVRRAQKQVAALEDADDSAFMAADTAFHLTLARAGGNELIVAGIEQILSELAPALQALPESGAWHNRSILDHAEIAGHILEGDAEASREAMGRHIAGTERAIEILLRGLSRPRRTGSGNA
jgi:GntR family transcriptional repressor for pyruvate dehydrogenase complex